MTSKRKDTDKLAIHKLSLISMMMKNTVINGDEAPNIS